VSRCRGARTGDGCPHLELLDIDPGLSQGLRLDLVKVRPSSTPDIAAAIEQEELVPECARGQEECQQGIDRDRLLSVNFRIEVWGNEAVAQEVLFKGQAMARVNEEKPLATASANPVPDQDLDSLDNLVARGIYRVPSKVRPIG